MLKASCIWIWVGLYQVAASRVDWSGLCSARVSVVLWLHTSREPWATFSETPDSDDKSLDPFQAARLYPCEPYAPTQLPPWGSGGGGGPVSPRKIPERTALRAVLLLVTSMVMVAPAATLIGTVTQAPWVKFLRIAAVCPLTVIVSLRPAESQSTA